MPEKTKDMTISDESVGEPTGEEIAPETTAAAPDQNLLPVPGFMEGTLKPGDTVTGTVIEKEGSLFVQIEAPESAESYTGAAPEDQEMNSEEALGKYLKGPMPTAATQ